LASSNVLNVANFLIIFISGEKPPPPFPYEESSKKATVSSSFTSNPPRLSWDYFYLLFSC
jgi:hypothetical protein